MPHEQVIYKYHVYFVGRTKLSIPAGAKPVHVAYDPPAELVAVWFTVPSPPFTQTTQFVEREFEVVPTGGTFPKLAQYIGTAHQSEPVLVWHVIEHPVGQS